MLSHNTGLVDIAKDNGCYARSHHVIKEVIVSISLQVLFLCLLNLFYVVILILHRVTAVCMTI